MKSAGLTYQMVSTRPDERISESRVTSGTRSAIAVATIRRSQGSARTVLGIFIVASTTLTVTGSILTASDETRRCLSAASCAAVIAAVVWLTYQRSMNVATETSSARSVSASASTSAARSERRFELWTYQTTAWESATTRTKQRRPGGRARFLAQSPPTPDREDPAGSQPVGPMLAHRSSRPRAGEHPAGNRNCEAAGQECSRRRRRRAHTGCCLQVGSRLHYTAPAKPLRAAHYSGECPGRSGQRQLAVPVPDCRRGTQACSA